MRSDMRLEPPAPPPPHVLQFSGEKYRVEEHSWGGSSVKHPVKRTDGMEELGMQGGQMNREVYGRNAVDQQRTQHLKWGMRVQGLCHALRVPIGSKEMVKW